MCLTPESLSFLFACVNHCNTQFYSNSTGHDGHPGAWGGVLKSVVREDFLKVLNSKDSFRGGAVGHLLTLLKVLG